MDNARSANPPSKNTTASGNVPVKKHKSTPNFKESWQNHFDDVNATPCHGFAPPPPPPPPPLPPPPSAASLTSFVCTSPERDIATNHPTIILVIDDNWDVSSADFPLQRVEQTIPVDITAEESSECSSHQSTDSLLPTPQHHSIRVRRRRAETSKSIRERCFKKYIHDPDASFLDMDVKTKYKLLWI